MLKYYSTCLSVWKFLSASIYRLSHIIVINIIFFLKDLMNSCMYKYIFLKYFQVIKS